MADDEDAGTEETPEEGDEVPEGTDEQNEEADETEEPSEDTAETDGDGDGADDEVEEDEGDGAPEEAEDGEDEEDDAPEEAADAEEDGEEAEDEEAETADAEEDEEGDETPEGDAAAEEDEDLEEIETAMAGEGEEDEEEPPSQPTVSTDGRFYGTGRRKEAVARVWIEAGSGEVTVNGNDLSAYFSSRAKWTEAVRGPLECLGMEDSVDVWATAEGGGLTGQADAIELGLARALVEMDENARHWLRPEGHLTRDDREVERKKINQPGARAKSQVSKR